MEIKKPTYEELEYEVNRLRKMQENNIGTNDAIHFHHASMNIVNNAIHTAADLEEMMSNVLQAVLDLFDSERAWLLFPCDPDAKSWTVPMERTKPGYEGVYSLGEEIPILPRDAEAFKRMQSSFEVVTYDYTHNPKETSQRFSILSEMHMPLHPKNGKSWLFGVHQCTYARAWTNEEKALFKEIGNRISDALNSFLFLNELKASESKFKSISEISPLAIYMSLGIEQKAKYINPTFVKLFGYTIEEVPTVAQWWPLAYPNEEYRNKLIKEWQKKIEHSINTKSEIEPMEVIVTCKDGSEKNIIWGFVSTDIQNWAFGLDITDRKKAEKEFIDSEGKYRKMAENMNSGVAIYEAINSGKDFKIIDFNKAAERITNTSASDVLGNTLLTQFPKMNKSPLYKGLQAVNESGEDLHIPAFFYEDNQRKGWRENYIYKLPSGEIVAIFDDVTAQKEAEIKLQNQYNELSLAKESIEESQKRYQSLFNNSPVPLWDEDFSEIKKYIDTLIKRNIRDFRKYFKNNPDEVKECVQLIKITDVNISVLRLHEAESKEELYKGLSSIFTDKSYEAFIEELITIAEGRSECEFVSNVKTLKGNEKEVNLKWMVLPGYEETLERVYLSTIDTTEQKKAEGKLRMFNRIINHSLNAFDIVNHEGKFIYVNQAYADIWGFETTDEIVGSSPNSHCDDENLPGHIVSEIKKNGEFISEIKAKRKDGSVFDVLMYARLDYDEDGNEIYPTTSLDITERKKNENKIKETTSNLESLLDNRKDSIWSIDKDYNYIILNKPYAEAILNEYGIKLEKGLNALGIQPVEIEEFWKSKYEPVFRGENNEFEFTHNINGIDHYFQVLLNPIISDGIVTGASALSMDISEKKLAQKEMKENQERLSEAERIGKIGNWSNELATGKIEWSEGLYRIFGLDPKQNPISYELMMKCIHKEDRDKQNNYFELMQGLLPDQTLETIEYRIVLPSEEIRWIELDFETQFDDNKPIYFFGTAKDITERKQAEYRIQESEEKYRALFENAPLSYQSLDEEGRFIDINPSWVRTLGYERDEVIGKFYADFLHPDWKPHFQENFPAFKKRGYVNDVEYKIKHKKGHFIDISFEGCIGYLPDGSFKQTYCVFQDITERKQAEKAFIESEERLKLALETYKTGAWELNLDDHSSMRTLLHDQIFGYETLLPTWTFEMFLEHVIAADRKKVDALFVKAVKTISDWDFECRIQRPDGEIRWIKAIGRHILNSDGKPSLLSGVVQDITDRKKIEKDLKKIHENLEELVDERTKELEGKNKLLERINKAFVGRELRMKDLKQEIEILKKEKNND